MRTRRASIDRDRVLINVLCYSIIIVALFVACIRYVDKKIQPALSVISVNKANQETVSILNDVITGFLDNTNMEYSNYVSILYDEKGNISSIETLTRNINYTQSELSNRINNNLQTKLNRVIDIPIGTVSGMYVFSGRGPNLKIKVIPKGNVRTNLKSEFTSAGINQTRHRILIEITVQLNIIMPSKSESAEITVDYVLAETIIVGAVPESYLNMSYPISGIY
ncbi:MAG: sporulation protein YunB [Clostridiales bacterium]|jgi:sporulation protein YunB|nr:sporulation protein YunB [Clostridiales bacterium]